MATVKVCMHKKCMCKETNVAKTDVQWANILRLEILFGSLCAVAMGTIQIYGTSGEIN